MLFLIGLLAAACGPPIEQQAGEAPLDGKGDQQRGPNYSQLPPIRGTIYAHFEYNSLAWHQWQNDWKDWRDDLVRLASPRGALSWSDPGPYTRTDGAVESESTTVIDVHAYGTVKPHVIGEIDGYGEAAAEARWMAQQQCLFLARMQKTKFADQMVGVSCALDDGRLIEHSTPYYTVEHKYRATVMVYLDE
jgi:hypothetical protein